MRKFEKNISVNVIATFEWDKYNEQQEFLILSIFGKLPLKIKNI